MAVAGLSAAIITFAFKAEQNRQGEKRLCAICEELRFWAEDITLNSGKSPSLENLKKYAATRPELGNPFTHEPINITDKELSKPGDIVYSTYTYHDPRFDEDVSCFRIKARGKNKIVYDYDSRSPEHSGFIMGA